MLGYFTPFRLESPARVAAAVVIACFAIASHADQIYQCKDAAGKVTYANVPCSGQGAPQASPSRDANDATSFGEWRGQTQFTQTVAGQAAGTAHVVAAMTLMIAPDGKVTGASTEAGCRVLGLVMPGPAATVQNVDVTFSSCNEGHFNRRYTGSFALYPQQKYAVIQLMSPSVLTEKPSAYSITATLRR